MRRYTHVVHFWQQPGENELDAIERLRQKLNHDAKFDSSEFEIGSCSEVKPSARSLVEDLRAHVTVLGDAEGGEILSKLELAMLREGMA